MQAAGGAVGMDRLKRRSKLRVTITRVGPARMDRDNNVASMKGVIDGIADAFCKDDGDEEYFDWQYDQRTGAKTQYAVEIRIEVIE